MLRNEASFRDPDGYVFEHAGGVYRGLTSQAAARLAAHSAFYAEAVERGLLVAFHEAAPAFGFSAVIAPERIPLVTYPHEWSYEQLKDAALNTLDVNILALQHGLTLKDASAFNNQTLACRSVFIDHTSFEETDGRLPWRPYSQFCRHFLNPLVVGVYRDIHVGSFFRSNLDGLQQQLANDLLPVRARIRPSVFVHMVAHNRFIRRTADFEGRTQATAVRARGRQIDLLRQLRGFIEGLSAARAASTWARYYESTNYVEAAFEQKKQIVGDCFAGRHLATVWDVGANDGTFSRLIDNSAKTVVALDLDHNAVNANYAFNRQHGRDRIHALVYDVGNPTPALGFRNRERSTLEERSRPDAIMALAVIHHLSLTNNVPLTESARYFAERTPELVIEWVGRGDSQVQRLLAQKTVSYDGYTEECFIRAYGAQFALLSRTQISGTDRAIYRFGRP
ncbi:MAG TPA: class I SAM-dependent methyltransferase [Hyphomicrobium sp.]|nr:class I SAM-dependent methyltransferase [Hyphomicrobium sp.]